MRVTLAYPFEGHDPDETIEVDDAAGRTMIRDGLARLPDSGDRTVAELKARAKELGVPLKGLRRREDIEAAIASVERAPEPASPTTVVAPVQDQNPTVAELKAFAEERGVSVQEAKRMWPTAHGAPPSTVVTPDAGTENEETPSGG